MGNKNFGGRFHSLPSPFLRAGHKHEQAQAMPIGHSPVVIMYHLSFIVDHAYLK